MGKPHGSRREVVRSFLACCVNLANEMRFEILGPISEVETIATGKKIRELARLIRVYGRGRWRKRKGVANVRFEDGSRRRVEIHWYEAFGIGRKDFKVKFRREESR
jgi:hypothetical protein